ncbi:MAG: class B sortase [Erysipelotrichales bacterium]|nr:class B sortase [Erysipelotrichales bacterium]
MKELVRKILLFICVCVFCYSAYQLLDIYLNYKNIEKQSAELVETYVKEPKNEEKAKPEERIVDFKELQKKNKDVIGWLYIPDTNIDEPILKGENNDTYLRTGIDHRSNSAGQVFIDEMNNKDFNDDNTIIYGHNMKNGSRFHNLRYYMKKEFFEEKSLVYIFLPNQSVNIYEVFSARVIDASSHLYQKDIDYKTYVKEVTSKARQCKEVSDEEAPLIMLSTCYDAGSDDRYVVFGRLKENIKQK